MDPEDRELFARYALLDETARTGLFERVWRRSWPRVRQYLALLPWLAAEDADELAGDAIMRAFDRHSTYDAKRPFEPWLHRVARSLALDRARRPASSREIRVDPGVLDSSRETEHAGPEESALASESIGEIARALELLPWKERELAMLVYGQGMKLGDAALATGESEGTVKWRLWKLRGRLARELGGLHD